MLFPPLATQNNITLKSFLLLFNSNKKILHLKRFANTALHLKVNKSKLYQSFALHLYPSLSFFFFPKCQGYRPSLSGRELNAWTQWGKQKRYLLSSRAKRRITYAVYASKLCLLLYNFKLYSPVGLFNFGESGSRFGVTSESMAPPSSA